MPLRVRVAHGLARVHAGRTAGWALGVLVFARIVGGG